ncbi:FAD-dependent oxidoreductase [Prauserella rugosa]|uniref:2-polyprenyl-6-methoxyphenol hydroxylase-like FAD-dependent oxidoreductase n=1 Tax=Prauserella rugosa TaxID=43354 RepID=A0A660CGW9_9PSEU|nr:FAD-dependent oxidoreductase [Prauserella rugosa]KMS90424.1 2-polyprenyl-6-methoxyphenol hydroxylase [Streptomyces regensis]TWH20271.1 2-polyprenyl-6-methoxyphenol hydroxylase-like FAD-dependent oxidoreductase [Prauserella rugosa]
MTTANCDVAIVGGGVAGTAAAAYLSANGLSVVLLERQEAYSDLVRGEWFAPWGVQEAQRLGVDEAVAFGGGWEIREWTQWDEVVAPDEAVTVDMTGFVPGAGGPRGFPHHLVCEAIAEQAAESGAEIVMGAADCTVEAGPEPVVRYRADGEHVELHARIVVGATGTNCRVGRQVGLPMSTTVDHWGAGLRVEGLADWPMDVQAMGTEGERNFMVFPQGDGLARLYLNYPTSRRHQYRGDGGVERFLAGFALDSLPDGGKSVYAAARPIGPLKEWPAITYRPQRDIVTDGVVLVGDEAGTSDTVLGVGLSCAMRDVRIVSDILLAESEWTPEIFRSYQDERRFRMERLVFGASVISRLQCEFGPEATARRRRVRALMDENSAAQVLGLLNMVPPEEVPEFGFSEFFVERLFRETV